MKEAACSRGGRGGGYGEQTATNSSSVHEQTARLSSGMSMVSHAPVGSMRRGTGVVGIRRLGTKELHRLLGDVWFV